MVSKKGMNNIVAAILLVLLALIAFLVLWLLFNRIVLERTEDITTGAPTGSGGGGGGDSGPGSGIVIIDVLSISLNINKGSIDTGNLNVDLRRGFGDARLSKVKFIIVAGGKQSAVDKDASDLAVSGTKSFSILSTEFPDETTYKDLEEIDIAPIVQTSSGRDYIGPIADKHYVNWCKGADVTRDGKVDIEDNNTYTEQSKNHRGCQNIPGLGGWCMGADINRDNKVDNSDGGQMVCSKPDDVMGCSRGTDGCECSPTLCGMPCGFKGCYCLKSGACECADGTKTCTLENMKPDYNCSIADVNNNKAVDSADFGLWQRNYHPEDYWVCENSNHWCEYADINKDGFVNTEDLAIITANMGRTDCI